MKQRGVALVTAIFLLVVLAALGAFVVSVSTTSQTASAIDLMSARAYQAARSGIEWGLYRSQISNSCVATSNVNFPASATTLGSGAATPFTVTVECTVTPSSNGSPPVTSITATACNRPNGGACPGTPGLHYVERRLRVRF